MMKSMILFKYAVASLFILSFSQNSWSADGVDHDELMEVPQPDNPPALGLDDAMLDENVLDMPPAEEVDPALIGQARQAADRAEKRLGLDKSPKIGIK